MTTTGRFVKIPVVCGSGYGHPFTYMNLQCKSSSKYSRPNRLIQTRLGSVRNKLDNYSKSDITAIVYNGNVDVNSINGNHIMRVIAVANQKGGSSKTTVSVNLAAGLSEQGKRTLLIDIDPQGNASQWLGIHDTGRGLLDVFVDNGNLLDIIHNTPFGVDVVPSSTWMIQAERLLLGEVGAEAILRHKLEGLKDKWDYVLIDCPPNLGILVINALVAANEVMVPVLSQILSVIGLSQLIETLDVVKGRINPTIHISNIVVSRFDARTRHSQEVIETLKDRFGDLVCKTVIRENIRIAEAPSFSQPVNMYDPHCRGTSDFRELAKEIISQTGTLSTKAIF